MIKGQTARKYINGNVFYDLAEQITLVAISTVIPTKKLWFMKDTTEQPNAYPIERSDKAGYVAMVRMTPEMTANMPTGRYACEMKQVIPGVDDDGEGFIKVLKSKGHFMNLKETITN